MNAKLLITISCLLLNAFAYSQNALIDETTGDTLVVITLNQMDDIYVELIQKDSLVAQAKINAFKELKYTQLIDSTRTNFERTQNALNDLYERYDVVLTSNQRQKNKLKRSRQSLLIALGVIALQIILK
ncbi:MAG: hypothetical protein CMJ25_19905 [Phycisphaerae bacterium]|nr:hypothetical protein [Phycisphaerae bacterium]